MKNGKNLSALGIKSFSKITILSLMLFTFNGCIGRTVVYDADKRQSAPAPEKHDSGYSSLSGSSYKKFILYYNPRINHEQAERIIGHVKHYSNVYSVDPVLIMALIARESSFRADVVSSSGAIGLGQLLSSTARDQGVNNPYDPEENIMGTVKFLSNLIRSWNGNIERALASYKMGLYTVKNLVNANRSLPQTTVEYINDIKSYQARLTSR